MSKVNKIGILGGGQLGAMLIRSAIDYGVDIAVMDRDADSPCRRYTSEFVIGDPLNYDDVVAFGAELDCITIEKEAVNTAALKALRNKGVAVYPSPEVIELIQNKYIQKKFLEGEGIPVARCVPVLDRADLAHHVNRLPGVLKKCTNGYDGKGVMTLHGREDIATAFDEPSILEELVDLKHELSVIVARGNGNNIEYYEPVMMIFDKEKHLLDFQVCPAGISTEIATEASNLALKIATALDLNGILAVEFFVTRDGKLLVNELAPRPHNSGHHTIEACATSQYEQLIRIMLGLPPGSARMNTASVMVNLVASETATKEHYEAMIRSVCALENVHLHWYGKKTIKNGRKMGHVTITAPDIESALNKAILIKNKQLQHAEN